MEYVYTWPNGEQHFYEATGSPLLLGGEIVGIAEITRDVTSRKLTEQILVKSREFSRAILMSLKDHIVVLDKAGIILSVNQSWLKFAREKVGLNLHVKMRCPRWNWSVRGSAIWRSAAVLPMIRLKPLKGPFVA